MSKWIVRDRKTKEKLAEHESRREAQNEVDWIEYCDKNNYIYEEDAYEIVKVEI